MLCIVNSSHLDFSFALDQPEHEILSGLRKSFIEKYGESIYTKISMLIVKEENFFNIIKDIYGAPVIGNHNDMLDSAIEAHLDI